MVMLLSSTLVFSQNVRTKLAIPAAWSNAAGWSPTGVPVSGERIIIPAGITVTTSTDLTFSSLYLDIFGKLVLGNNRTLTLISPASYINVQSTGSIEASQTSNNNSIITINGLTQFVSNQTYSSNGGGKGVINGPALATGAGAGFSFGMVLPLKFSPIQVKQLNGSVSIRWQTFEENSTRSFTIERSTDSRSWTSIGKMNPGAASSNHYQFSDLSPRNGINYYRVCAVDSEGIRTYSEILTAQYNSAANNIEISPNPARTVANINVISINPSESSTLNYRLYSNAGLMVDHGTFTGTRTMALNVGSLANGAYQLVLTNASGGDHYSRSLFVQH